MNLALSHRLLSPDPLSPADAHALRAAADAVRSAMRAGDAQRLLKDKNIALLCKDPAGQQAQAVVAAASALGARVTPLQPDAALESGAPSAGPLARMLGLLYDAVACEELPPPVAERLARLLQVPVYDGLGRPDHPLKPLLPSPPETPGELIQALLVHTMA